MLTNKTNVINTPLNVLFNTGGDKILSEVVEFVTTLLTPVKKNLDRDGHRFSSELLVVSILYALKVKGEWIDLESVLPMAISLLGDKEKDDQAMILLPAVDTVKLAAKVRSY